MIHKIFSYLIYLKQFYKSSILEVIKYYNTKSKELILVEGYAESRNFGDALNVPLIEHLSNKKVLFSKFLPKIIKRKDTTYAVIGSILQWSQNNCVIWGAGFISDKKIRVVKPKKIHAVRGPLTRKIFLDNNIECPEIYGDPALLLPFIYDPVITKKYEIGFIPHFMNKNSEYVKHFENDKNCTVLDILERVDYQVFVDNMLSCKSIVTSSLHGLIVAHSYNIPVLWVQYSVELVGGKFKFEDYLHSVNKQTTSPLFVSKHYTVEEYINMMDTKKIVFDYEKLVHSCPFISTNRKLEIISKINKSDKI
ncbi:polysaccharide pyruvyl transferase family protein [Flavobacterium restrictum]|uniref:Polysaccharide pyruvyl transferase family protein n=1 Tax=Flavobacterium restrictum TaxID=2594428 RepID=A0A553DWK0_9FLAO|nr:polysaccharide pyruvyl transferase family protein [Flavobacterium restrictum]TRX37060.1 polysaccharide pyruvyl transferase family protein [Flavobacterium restrictum]